MVIDSHRPFKEYITEYQSKAKNREIDTLSQMLGLDEIKLVALMNTNITEANINEYGRFDELKATVDKQKAKAYLEALEGQKIPPFKLNIRIDTLLQKFITEGGFELDLPENGV